MLANREELRALRYDERLLRLFYSSDREGGFTARHIGPLQLVLATPACRTFVPAPPPLADRRGVPR